MKFFIIGYSIKLNIFYINNYIAVINSHCISVISQEECKAAFYHNKTITIVNLAIVDFLLIAPFQF